jgi:hypothetical protein
MEDANERKTIVFELGSCCVAQAGLELSILLPGIIDMQHYAQFRKQKSLTEKE